jgi:hypothetical protein
MINPASPAAAAMSAATATMAQGEIHTTLYLADPQLEHLGPRSCVDNPLVDAVIHSADRNLISTATTPLYIDTLLDHVRRFHNAQSLQILGDVPDTPCADEINHMEAVLDRHGIPVDGYDRGNHSSSNAYGVVNLGSRLYRFLVRWILRHDPLKEDTCQSCGSVDNLLTPEGTFRGMHRILHRHHPNPPPIDKIATSVKKASGRGYTLPTSRAEVPFTSENSARTFETFWKPTAGVDGKTRYWETLVNFETADLPIDKRPSAVTPFYVQATEEARFHLDDGTQVPVYNISMDSLDNGSPIAVIPGISALQVRLVENFIDEKLKENPNARFKLSSHFSAIRIMKGDTSCEARALFRKLLSREQVVLFSGGHTHIRELANLTERLKLDRKTDLMEFIIPSLIDFSPSHNLKSQLDQDGRALMIEKMTVDKDAQGRPILKIDLEYQGLDREDLDGNLLSSVEERLEWFKKEHGYQRAKETLEDLKRKHIRGFFKRRLRMLGQLFTSPIKTLKRLFSPVQAAIDNFTVVSAVQMFNETKHFVPFLDSILHFIDADQDPGELAARAQIEGVRTLLQAEYDVRRPQFEAEVARGESAVDLKRFADLYQRAGLHVIPELLLKLKLGGRARAFAVLAGLDASQEEYEYEGGKPTDIPNKVPVVSVRLTI